MKRPSPKQKQALEAIAAGRMLPCLVEETDGWHARWRALDGDNPWLDALVREAAATPLTSGAENQRYDTLHDAWLAALRSETGLVKGAPGELSAFAHDLDEWGGAVRTDRPGRAGIVFSLVQDGEGFAVETPVPRGRAALAALGQSMFVFPPLAHLAKMPGGVLRVRLSRAEALSFAGRGSADLENAGYRTEGCEISARVSAAAGIDDVPPSAGGGEADASAPSASLRITVKVAGEPVDAAEIRFLLDQNSPIVFFRDRWIEVDRNILKEALRVLERQDGKALTRNEALFFASGLGSAGKLDIDETAVKGAVARMLAKVRSGAAGAAAASAPQGLAGELKDYQKRGVAWMRFLSDNGFGALLADDMGLGKTVQAIAWILSNPSGRTLVAAPLTLLPNWRRELARFAPSLRVRIHHGDSRLLGSGLAGAVSPGDVVLVSHSLLARDLPALRRVKWDAMVLDEAQAVKNPASRIFAAACALRPGRRIALTGTPVENTPLDLWSLEAFLNPGLLGDAKAFSEKFARPLSGGVAAESAAKLSRAMEPFVLRRLKTDAAVCAEIGPKREIREYCALSPAQRAEYEDALERYRTGEKRQGDAFALITALKLACDGEGKMERLGELLESIFASGESALVFTQYAKAGAAIRAFLGRRFGRTFPFLHGALDATAREREIAAFESDPAPCAFILSLRAGGYGLNLVKATRVIHFDRWWNPAVEAQATDRAHRIGQARTVFVHSFITEGTLEERIDRLLDAKSRLAGSVIRDGEGFLRSLAPEEFDRVVSLG